MQGKKKYINKLQISHPAECETEWQSLDVLHNTHAHTHTDTHMSHCTLVWESRKIALKKKNIHSVLQYLLMPELRLEAILTYFNRTKVQWHPGQLTAGLHELHFHNPRIVQNVIIASNFNYCIWRSDIQIIFDGKQRQIQENEILVNFHNEILQKLPHRRLLQLYCRDFFVETLLL